MEEALAAAEAAPAAVEEAPAAAEGAVVSPLEAAAEVGPEPRRAEFLGGSKVSRISSFPSQFTLESERC